MAINKKDVERIAKLARIGLDEKEKEKMAGELGAVLGYIDKLKEVSTDGAEPMAHASGLENVLRKDEINKKPLEQQAKEAAKLIEMAPEKKDNFIKVLAVFKGNH